jgi:hypothetical protein
LPSVSCFAYSSTLKILRNVGKILPVYTALHPRRQYQALLSVCILLGLLFDSEDGVTIEKSEKFCQTIRRYFPEDSKVNSRRCKCFKFCGLVTSRGISERFRSIVEDIVLKEACLGVPIGPLAFKGRSLQRCRVSAIQEASFGWVLSYVVDTGVMGTGRAYIIAYNRMYYECSCAFFLFFTHNLMTVFRKFEEKNYRSLT